MRSVLLFSLATSLWAQFGNVTDPQGRPIPGAVVAIKGVGLAKTNPSGEYMFHGVAPGTYTISVVAPGFTTVVRQVVLPASIDLQFTELSVQNTKMVISARGEEAAINVENITRDDQMLRRLNSGIDVGQHEGGGKSLEVRRFGFNLDHGGVNGGLKVLLDDVQQNQGTQGHGQGYLGSLKALSPELIQEVTILDGPFSPEYGDFSGLGVVHIRQRESLADRYTLHLEGGNFNERRGFFAFSPDIDKVDAYAAYDGSYTDGPFVSPGRYRRDNINANYTRALGTNQKLGFRFIFGRNNFYSSGQLPEDLVDSGVLDRFGYVDPTDGGRVKTGTLSSYFSRVFTNGDTLRVDGFLGRSLFDLYSNFTFFLNDPVNGDAFQQHDSRLQEGVNAQYQHPHRVGSAQANFTAGSNFHDNQINVGLYSREGRTPTGVLTRDHAHVTNEAGYAQESLSLLNGRLIAGGGVRFDEFRYAIENSGTQYAGRWQGKGNAAFTPSKKLPVTLHVNYGRGINSVDARGVVQMPNQPRLATTDFYQAGVSSTFSRLSLTADLFLIDHSNEQVYIPDDGSFEFKGPTRAYGLEAKAAVKITRHVSVDGGVTKVSNAFYKGGQERVYVDSAPHFVANTALVVAPWRGWNGALRMRAINHYRLDGTDPAIAASGHAVFDAGVNRRLSPKVDLNLSMDNLTNRDYFETQNYFESRVTPSAAAMTRIHATPAYPFTAVVGLTVRLGGK